MARRKIDGVIEAVRYNADGSIRTARGYERRGVVWTDEIMLGREDLLDRLNRGKLFVTGVRKQYLGSVFETGQPIHLTDGRIVTNGQSVNRDLLEGVGSF